VPQKAVYLLVFDGFADWEPAHAVAELRREGQYRVEIVATTREPVASMGGISVLPSRTVVEVDADDVAIFILPGAIDGKRRRQSARSLRCWSDSANSRFRLRQFAARPSASPGWACFGADATPVMA
jgi:putative intracellular protease/amidase